MNGQRAGCGGLGEGCMFENGGGVRLSTRVQAQKCPELRHAQLPVSRFLKAEQVRRWWRAQLLLGGQDLGGMWAGKGESLSGQGASVPKGTQTQGGAGNF